MPSALSYRVDVTPEIAARAAPTFVELASWWSDRWYASSGRRRGRRRVLRWLGLAVSFLGIALTAVFIALAPDAPCRRGPPLVVYDLAMAFFVVAAVLFGFLERLAPALEAWSRRVGERQALRVAERARRDAPFSVEYALEGGRLAGRVTRPKLARVTELARVEAVAFAGDVACLYGGRLPRLVKRFVWLPDAPLRGELRAALEAAGVGVVELPGADVPGAGT